ncbi:MAG: flagellar motor switch protein FliN [Gemmatimonadetes bacterium]|jgi:flagellar motor switch protein FliN|nr:flagellar motor switch protein FliN [Gemmatimonadota bacterium]MBT6149308.1 flagellar motor switch protein FliN [Gemmatimonadota bacterium]MBT7861135.1 flagellar motor switch protein FliN [Gemmatimonadota bacterium]
MASKATQNTTPDTAALVDDVDMTVSVELGRSMMSLDSALDLSEQSMMELNRNVGDPVDIRLNGRLFARGEVVTVGENFGVRITEILTDDIHDA